MRFGPNFGIKRERIQHNPECFQVSKQFVRRFAMPENQRETRFLTLRRLDGVISDVGTHGFSAV